MKVMKNIKFPDHIIIRKKESILLYDKTGTNNDIVLKKGNCLQMVKADQRTPISVCVIWDYKNRGWRLHESCAPKGGLGI